MEPIEDVYFNWLCAKVTDRNTSNHVSLLILLHRTEFVSVIAADRHRASEGVELRFDFLREVQIESDALWEDQPCSVLEMLVAFAKRASFQTDIKVKTWFWEILSNLKLNEFRRVSGNDVIIIKDILDTFLLREYSPSGEGGMFPMSRSNNDQRDTEIWYQFCEYVDDRGII